ncbi:histidine kinase [Zobellella denitrificans]|uniref:diguanylate cyclase n=1 Tax=Zobellella denitrificans TaxID=347534 RepID=A0A291HV16_9GAMM|nr:histidine kinase [Zobellella denitrificans]
MVAALWFALLLEQGRNRAAVERDAHNEAANLARAFEEHVVRIFHDVNAALLLLRQAWGEERSSFEQMVRIIQKADGEALLVQIAVIGADGLLAYSNLDPDAEPVDLSDREHFQVHRESKEDNLFISKPILGRVSGRYSIQVTRPLLNELGGFIGVLVISLSPDYFSRFFGSVDLGRSGSISLVGTDGVFRARGSDSRLDTDSIGTRVPPDRPFLQPDAPTSGMYEADSTIDGIRRFVSYRLLPGYSMVVAVTKAVEEVFAEHERRWLRYRLGAGLVSLLLLAGAGWLARSLQLQRRFKHQLLEQQRRLLYVNDSLRILNDIATQPDGELAARLHLALALGCRHLGVEFGIVSRVSGDRYRVECCFVPPTVALKAGDEFALARTYCSITLGARDLVTIEHMSHSEYAGHPCFEAFRLEAYFGIPIKVNGAVYGTLNFSSTQPHSRVFDSSDREFLRLLARWVGTVIAEERTHNELKTLATTDALTGAMNRGSFVTEAEQEIGRARRYQQPLSLLLLDLDYFKRVNDSYGHSAGDEVLKAVAEFSRETLRTNDRFARIGGEEFAALLPYTAAAEAMEVGERLRTRIAAAPVQTAEQRISVTISVGITELVDDDDFNTLYNRADAALYRAKHQGRNRVVGDPAAPSDLAPPGSEVLTTH